jgi:flagellar protein FlbD
MITVTRFDGSTLVVNAELIEFVEANPDTVLSMTTGRKVLVRESPETVIQAVIDYKQKIFRTLQSQPEV